MAKTTTRTRSARPMTDKVSVSLQDLNTVHVRLISAKRHAEDRGDHLQVALLVEAQGLLYTAEGDLAAAHNAEVSACYAWAKLYDGLGEPISAAYQREKAEKLASQRAA